MKCRRLIGTNQIALTSGTAKHAGLMRLCKIIFILSKCLNTLQRHVVTRFTFPSSSCELLKTAKIYTTCKSK